MTSCWDLDTIATGKAVSDIQIYDPVEKRDTGTVNFGLRVDGVRYAVLVSYEALRDYFGADDSDGSVIKSFRDKADEIAEIAARKIRNGDPDPVQVSTTDFQRSHVPPSRRPLPWT